MVPLNDEILAAFIAADRLAAAERVRLVRHGRGQAGHAPATPWARSLRSALVQVGRLLVRLGHRLECLGGECATSPGRDARQVVRA